MELVWVIDIQFVRDKRKQRDIVIQFCNSLYEKTVLTIIKSTWNLKYAEIKQILYRSDKHKLHINRVNKTGF
jgi:hypothetical protein